VRARERQVFVTASRYSGSPLHPQLLEQYERLVPGSAQRLLARFEKQSDHRMLLERKVIESDARRADWGVGAGLLVVLVGFGLGYHLIMAGHDLAGTAFGVTSLVSLVGTFIYGTNTRKEERIKRAKLMTGQERNSE
jgi:uncharacterized membrane protein